MNDLFPASGNDSLLDYGQAIIVGLRDSVNPGGISGIVIYLLVLIWLSRYQRVFFVACMCFLFGNLSATFAHISGVFDVFLASKAYDTFLDVAYAIVAVAAVIFGCLFFRDWFFSLRNDHSKRSRIRLPFLEAAREPSDQVFQHPSSKKTRRKRPGLPLLAYVLGIILAFLEAAWAPDKYTVSLVYELTYHGKYLAAIPTFILYGVAYVFPLILEWHVFSWIMRSENIKVQLRTRISIVQIIFSAIFLAYGFTFIYRYYILV